MHRFYGDFTFEPPTLNLSQNRDIVHQLVDVLKMKKGEQISLFNDKGEEAICTIELIHKKELIVEVGVIKITPVDTGNKRCLFCAILKKDNFELVVQKAAEVGITDIYPVITDRTIKQGLRLDRLDRIAAEATEQSYRMRVPMVHPIIDSIEEAIGIAEELGGLNLCLDMSADTIRPVVEKNKREIMSVFVGPEGGWSEKERKLFEKDGWKIVSLGDGVYRSETAAIVAGYLISN